MVNRKNRPQESSIQGLTPLPESATSRLRGASRASNPAAVDRESARVCISNKRGYSFSHRSRGSRQPLGYRGSATLGRSDCALARNRTAPLALRFSRRARIAIVLRACPCGRATRVCIRCIVRSPLHPTVSTSLWQYFSIYSFSTPNSDTTL